jgi:hypothetical protein
MGLDGQPAGVVFVVALTVHAGETDELAADKLRITDEDGESRHGARSLAAP